MLVISTPPQQSTYVLPLDRLEGVHDPSRVSDEDEAARNVRPPIRQNRSEDSRCENKHSPVALRHCPGRLGIRDL